MTRPAIHLNAHSHYSLLSALPKIPALVAAAKAADMPAIALTDNGNLYGAISFYKECRKQDIKPIIGVDFYVATRTRHDKEAGIDNRRHRLILLARDEEGYKNLIKLVTYSHLEGFYYKPRIDDELIAKYGGHLVCIVPPATSALSASFRAHNIDEISSRLATYQDAFGSEHVFLGINSHTGIDGSDILNASIIDFARQTETPLVALQEIFYLTPEDKSARNTLLSIQSSGSRAGGFGNDDADFSFLTQGAMQELFRHAPDALENTSRIADMCTLELELGKWMFPHFEIKSGLSPEEELRRITAEGLTRHPEVAQNPESEARIAYELETICSKGYAPYFLVVSDLMRYAHENGVLTNTRGSAAGSLVSYLTEITTIDPLAYDLPFERFLNPFRPSPPDIDLDIADNRRDEMIEYTREKYGADKVAQIGTFGTMMARGSVRDTARALGFDYATGDRAAKLIPFGAQGFPMTIDRALKEEPDFKKLYEDDEDVRRVVDMAKKIEGCARHISVHAAGVVISPIPLVDIVPTQYDPKGEGKIITQYDMHEVKEAGLLKFDFLGLKNLAILADAITRVEKIYGEKVDIENVPLDDRKTFAMLTRGETMGIFQLAGGAMTQFLIELKPTTVHDLNAMVALYRPGPMKNIPKYIARKHGKEPVTYYHPKMEKFLDKSYGILVYQDDLLSTALEVAGYTWQTVDKFRKAVGKKIPAEMARQHEIFVAGCIEHSGMTKSQAEELWDLFEPFQGYGFNKAHAASYGRVAYQTAYMKANYPVVYMSAILTADAGDVEKISEAITECVRMGIPVLPPDINESFSDFTVVKKKDSEDGVERIRFGLSSIKNFGEGIGNVIIEERKANGKFSSLADFLSRIHDRNLNKKSLESLIKCGALDRFRERGALLAAMDEVLAYNRAIGKAPEHQDSLFGAEASGPVPLTVPEAKPATLADKLSWEKELLGLYISGHPMEVYKNAIPSSALSISKVMTLESGMMTAMYGVIDECRAIMTKSGEKMAFVKLSDMSGGIEVVFFPRTYREFRDLLVPTACIAVKGRLSARNGEKSIIAEHAKALSPSA